MNTMSRLLVIACLALPFAACKKEEAPKVEAVAAPLTAPTSDDVSAWRTYVTDVAKRNMDGVNNSPYVYFLPSEGSEGFGGQYERLLEKVEGDLSRGIIEGNMLVFASPASTKIAELAVTGFGQVGTGTMKGVKVVFIGKPEDGEKVKAAAEPAGVKYVFVEAK
ncbi:hypothetical protein [Thermomonas sp. HDW16]|uniref:hypothetical protein n=1 Tax=Thermomonas sp. HDW16 TaxID=2714945 RepID=UPI001407F1F0|nr:hypothetical protein [Thermomonas sp. HDW16]QIL20111.1 hypothetical protein G7079_04820 [Thermomonas sp. HDW16]